MTLTIVIRKQFFAFLGFGFALAAALGCQPADVALGTDASTAGTAGSDAADGGLACSFHRPSSPPLCGAAQCGNGVRDTCYTQGPNDPGPAALVEQCDGVDVGGRTCASLGFAAGTLACAGNCWLDLSECKTCAPTSLDGPDCSRFASQAYGIALAASTTEIGLAAVVHDSACDGVRFERYSPDLERGNPTTCIAACGAYGVSLAPTSSGWLLAILRFERGTDLVALDGQGNVTRPPRIMEVAGRLVPRGSGGVVTGGPLFMWGDNLWNLNLALLRDDGSEEQPVVTVGPTLFKPGAAIFTGDGFLFATHKGATPADPTTDDLAFQHLALDGSLSTEHRPFPTFAAHAPELAWTGSEVRLTLFLDNANRGFYWARLGPHGALLEAPRRIGDFDRPAPVVMVGSDMVLLTQDGFVHMDADGTLRDPIPLPGPRPFSGVPEQPQLVLRGTNAFGAWRTTSAAEAYPYWEESGRAVLVRVP